MLKVPKSKLRFFARVFFGGLQPLLKTLGLIRLLVFKSFCSFNLGQIFVVIKITYHGQSLMQFNLVLLSLLLQYSIKTNVIQNQKVDSLTLT